MSLNVCNLIKFTMHRVEFMQREGRAFSSSSLSLFRLHSFAFINTPVNI